MWGEELEKEMQQMAVDQSKTMVAIAPVHRLPAQPVDLLGRPYGTFLTTDTVPKCFTVEK